MERTAHQVKFNEKEGKEKMTDLTFTDCGSLWLLFARSESGAEWINEHLPDATLKWLDAVVIEHRFVSDIAYGAASDGLGCELRR
jgi:hypothetical protein